MIYRMSGILQFIRVVQEVAVYVILLLMALGVILYILAAIKILKNERLGSFQFLASMFVVGCACEILLLQNLPMTGFLAIVKEGGLLMYDKSLNDFLRIIQSPEAYPQFVGNAFLQTGVLKAVGSLLMFVGIFGFLFMVIKFAVDIIILSGALYVIGGSGAIGDKITGIRDGIISVSSFSSEEAKEASQEPLNYFKGKFWKNILLLILIIMLSSGLFLPIVSAGTALGGGLVAKALSINPVEYLKYIDISPEAFANQVSRMKEGTLMNRYSEAVKQASIALDVATSENADTATVLGAKNAYAVNLAMAQKLSDQIKAKKDEIQAAMASMDRKITDDEKALTNFNNKLHEQYTNMALITGGPYESSYTQIRNAPLANP